MNNVMPWLHGIISDSEYQELLAITEELIEDYDANQTLLDLLFPVIEKYEEESERFAEFNKSISEMDQGVAMLRVLIDQYGLTFTIRQRINKLNSGV